MRINYENLNVISNQLEDFKKMGVVPEERTPYLLASIAVSIAQIADVMISKVESEPQETETWNGIHGQITAPKGTFERIFNDTDDDNDI